VRRFSVLIAVAALAVLAPAGASAMPQYQVAGLQVALYRYGHYKGPIDGIAGPMTNRAIVAFQRERKLTADGKAGKQTRVALGRYGRPLFGVRTLRRGKVGFDVSVLQFLLAKSGLPPKRLNSNFGPATEELVRRFQRKAGLPVDGVVGKATRAALVAGKKATKPKKATKATKVMKTTKRHVVRPGETLTAIAERNGTTVRALASRNKLDPSGFLLIGATLLVPKSGPAVQRTSVVTSIDHWASHHGVNPKLARALAWQESGFQPDVRSSVNAVGVMQVMPKTRDFVELFVIGQRVPRTTDGNIRVGVAYLGFLLGEFKGNVRRAVGAYYQGPAAVQQHGLYPETRRFVANVLALRGRV
jgi:peptidoglycan hydrolase-like protein with peptidoglycan-binding domain